MAQDTDNNGVMTDSEVNDPSQDDNAPDPLIGESARSGALSIGSKADTQSRAGKARASMEDLQGQYGAVQKGLAGAYGAQTKALQDARDKLLSMNFGPSGQEQAYRRAAAFTQTPGFNPGDVSTANANNMEAVRNAELQKQQLAAQYGMQGAAAQIGQYGAMGSSLLQRMRLAQSDVNNASGQANKVTNQAPKTIGATGMVFNQESGQYEMHPEIAQAQEAQKAKNAKDAQAAKFTAASLSAGNMDPTQIDFAAQWLHDKGTMPPGYQARMTNGQVNPVTTMVYKRMLEKFPDESASQIIANQGMVAASQGVLKDFESGKTSAQLNGLNTAVQHINVLKPVLAQLNNGQVPFLNSVKNTWNQQIMGSPAPTDFNGVRDFVVGEISKAVLPGGGGEQERQALAKSAGQSNSGPALNSILQKWQELLAGKTTATRLQWDNGTMGRFGAFDRFLLPDTRAALGIHAPAAPVARPGQTRAIDDPLVQQYLKQVPAAPPVQAQ
jgi:hypothetical protein